MIWSTKTKHYMTGKIRGWHQATSWSRLYQIAKKNHVISKCGTWHQTSWNCLEYSHLSRVFTFIVHNYLCVYGISWKYGHENFCTWEPLSSGVIQLFVMFHLLFLISPDAFLVNSILLSIKFRHKHQALDRRITWVIYTPYTCAAEMLLHLNLKFIMGKLKWPLLSQIYVLNRLICMCMSNKSVVL